MFDKWVRRMHLSRSSRRRRRRTKEFSVLVLTVLPFNLTLNFRSNG